MKSVIDRLKSSVPDLSSGILVFCVSLLVFVSIMVLGIQTDIQTHIIRNSYPNPNPGLMPNFLFYWAVWLLSFLLRSRLLVGGVVAIILALAVLWKYWVSLRIINRELDMTGQSSIGVWTRGSSIGLVFLFSLPVSLNLADYYLGQFPANIWHNSTTIAVMPFVILAFDSCCQYLSKADSRIFKKMMLWSALIYIIKPSIIPILIVALPVFTLLIYGVKRPFILSLVYGLIFGLLLILPVLLIQNGSSDKNQGEGLEVALFEVWSLYSDNYVASLLASLFFPLTCFVLYLKKAIRDIPFTFSWVIWVMSFLLFALVNETGDSLKAGNFGWQVIMASYLLFLISLVFFNRIRAGQKSVTWKEKIVMSAFCLHLISGIVYLVKMMIWGFG